ARTGEAITHASSLRVERHVVEHNLAAAVGAGEDLRPDRVVDVGIERLALRWSDGRLVHPRVLLVEAFEEPFGGDIEPPGVVQQVEAGRDEGRRRSELPEDCPPRAPLDVVLAELALGRRPGLRVWVHACVSHYIGHPGPVEAVATGVS